MLDGLRGVVERERGAMGALICMEEPTRPMRVEAATAGFVSTAWGKYPRIQIKTIEELLTGLKLEAPNPLDVTYKQAPRAVAKAAERQPEFALEPEPSMKKSKMVKAALPLGFREAKPRRRKRGA